MTSSSLPWVRVSAANNGMWVKKAGFGTVYGLVDPRLNEVVYIGSTFASPGQRFSHHMSVALSWRGSRSLCEWLHGLFLLGYFQPGMITIAADVPVKELTNVEMREIQARVCNEIPLLNRESPFAIRPSRDVAQTLPQPVRDLLLDLRAATVSEFQIGDILNREGVPAPGVATRWNFRMVMAYIREFEQDFTVWKHFHQKAKIPEDHEPVWQRRLLRAWVTHGNFPGVVKALKLDSIPVPPGCDSWTFDVARREIGSFQTSAIERALIRAMPTATAMKDLRDFRHETTTRLTKIDGRLERMETILTALAAHAGIHIPQSS